MATRQERILEMKGRAARMKARAQLLEAQDQKSERKLRERRKYVAGAAVMAAIAAGEMEPTALTVVVDRHNRRKGDRALFGLDE